MAVRPSWASAPFVVVAPARARWSRMLQAGRGIPRGGIASVGVVILVIVVSAGLFAPWIAPHGYDDQDLVFALQPPVWAGGAWSNALGTDPLGRDVLSRIIYGARTSLVLGLAAVLIASVVGVALGLASGYVGGRV